MHRLSNRMLMNVSLIPEGRRVADIGCDHGWVSVYLVKNDIAEKVFAMDVAPGPLSGARKHVEDAGLTDRIECRLSDGLSELGFLMDGSPEAEVILMAGIGGRLSVKLIKDSLSKCRAADAIVLQAQSELDYVRESVYSLGFVIDAEKMVFEDGKYYTAMRLIYKGEDRKIILTEEEKKYGPVLIKEMPPVLISYLQYKKESYNLILSRLLTDSKDINSEKNIREELSIIEGLLDSSGINLGGK